MLVLSGETGFGFSDYTYSPFVNMKYDESDYKKRKHFVMDYLETYSLPEKVEVKHDILGTEILDETIADAEETIPPYSSFITRVGHSFGMNS